LKHQSIDNFGLFNDAAKTGSRISEGRASAPSTWFHVAKRFFDVVMCIALLPVMVLTCVALLILNPMKNKGPLFFVQTRMGRNCRPFSTIKFRSMTVIEEIDRGVGDPLEIDRITPLGDFLRRSRLDEIPQIINVIKGDMSLIGPRPDYFVHAVEFVETIPGYKKRHTVRPGISGFAQTEVGYVESIDAVKQKVAADLHYISNRSFKLETWIVWRTIQTVVKRAGA